MILRDPYNLGEAVAADPDTLAFIGELRIQQLVGQCPGGQITRDQIKAAMRRQRSLAKGYGEYLAALQAIAANQGWQTEREALLERAGVRTGTDSRALLPAAVVPGAAAAQAPRAKQNRETAPTFISDAVAEDAHAFREMVLEDDSATGNAQNARSVSMLPPRRSEISSPFVDDAVKEFMATWDEPEEEKGE
jgi:hypothetical protein